LVDPTGYGFWEALKDWFVSFVIKTIVDIFLPNTTVKTGIPERSVQAGYEAYRAGQNPWRAAAIEAAVAYTEYAVAGATFGLTEDPRTAYRAGRAAGQATRQALEDAWEDAQAVAQDLGVSAGRAADAVAEALATPNTLAQVAQYGQGGAQLLGHQGLTNQLAQRLTPNDEQQPGSNNQRLRAGLLTALSLGVEYAAEKLPPGTARGIVKVAGAGFAIHGAYEAGFAGLSSLAFAITGPTPPFPPHVRMGAAVGGVAFIGAAFNNIIRAQHLFRSGLSEIYGKN